MKSKAERISTPILHLILLAVCFISLYPVFIMISGSLKHISELFSNSAGFPIQPTLDNYRRLLGYNSGLISRAFLNSLLVSTCTTALQLAVASMAGYAFSKYTFKGKNLIFGLLLMTMMVPGELLITPQFLIFSKLGWLNTYQVQIIPAIANTFAMFMFRQYMDSIPNELIEAARIDGAGHARVFLSIIVPTSIPTFGALGILQFLAKWNDYLYPKIMINKPLYKPIMVVLPTLTEGGDTAGIPYDLVLAGCTLVIIPMIIVFLCLQNKFLDSVSLGAVKG